MSGPIPTLTFELAFRSMLVDVMREVVREELGPRSLELPTELLTYEQAAKAVSVSVSTLKRWVRGGRLATIGEGRIKRVRADALRACLENTRASAAQKPDVKATVSSILASLPRRG